jgi:type I restriction enzyme S subunit
MIFNDSKYNSNWLIKELQQLGEFSRGKSKHRPRNDKRLFINGSYPFIQTGEIKEANLYIKNNFQSYNDFGLKQSKLWPANTLCITIAANIAETSLLGYPMCFPDSVVGFNAFKEESSELFMHYVFKYIKKKIQNSASGSIQDNINIDFLTGLKFRVPSKQYQDKIAQILSSLDKKIDINNNINTELELMVKTFYDYWFVQFDFPNTDGKPYKSSGGKMKWNDELKREIPDYWQSNELESIITKSGTGLNPRDNFKLGNGNNFYITIKNVKNNKIVFDETCDRIDDDALKIINKRSDLKPGDILFTSIEPVGVTYLIHDTPSNWNINESVFTIRPYYSRVTSEYLYMLLSSSQMKAFTRNVSYGSVHKGIRHSLLKTFKLAYGGKELIDRFTTIVSPLLKRIDIIDKENQKLVELRDWLLPMLMNGQVKVAVD